MSQHEFSQLLNGLARTIIFRTEATARLLQLRTRDALQPVDQLYGSNKYRHNREDCAGFVITLHTPLN